MKLSEHEGERGTFLAGSDAGFRDGAGPPVGELRLDHASLAAIPLCVFLYLLQRQRRKRGELDKMSEGGVRGNFITLEKSLFYAAESICEGNRRGPSGSNRLLIKKESEHMLMLTRSVRFFYLCIRGDAAVSVSVSKVTFTETLPPQRFSNSQLNSHAGI